MIILDPDMDGCTVWLINSAVTNNVNKVVRIKGTTIEDTCRSLVNRLTKYVKIEDQWVVIWRDCVYLDIAAMGHMYKDVFEHRYGLPILDVTPGSVNNIVPERW